MQLLINASEVLNLDEIYSRKGLAEKLRIVNRDLDSTYATGIVVLSEYTSVFIFVTEKKPKDRTQYEDKLVGDDLFMEGQTSRRTDNDVINHRRNGRELLLFYRERKNIYQREGYGYRYEGVFDYVPPAVIKDGRATRFQLHRRLGSRPAISYLLNTNALAEAYWESEPFNPLTVKDERIRVMRSIASRRGQRKFREGLLAAYEKRCAITSCDCVETLEAAHIIPYRGEQTNHISNGLLLRSDLHVLFDLGLIAVDTKELILLVSEKLQSTTYSDLSSVPLKLPIAVGAQPSFGALDIHRLSSFDQ